MIHYKGQISPSISAWTERKKKLWGFVHIHFSVNFNIAHLTSIGHIMHSRLPYSTVKMTSKTKMMMLSTQNCVWFWKFSHRNIFINLHNRWKNQVKCIPNFNSTWRTLNIPFVFSIPLSSWFFFQANKIAIIFNANVSNLMEKRDFSLFLF